MQQKNFRNVIITTFFHTYTRVMANLWGEKDIFSLADNNLLHSNSIWGPMTDDRKKKNIFDNFLLR